MSGKKKSPSATELQLKRDHSERRFSVFGLEGRDLHLQTLFTPTALRALLVFVGGLFAMYLVSRNNPQAYALCFGGAAVFCTYIYYTKDNLSVNVNQMLIAGATLSGMIAVTGGLRPVFFSRVVSALAVVATIGLIYGFFHASQLRKRFGYYPRPATTVLLIAVCGLVAVWPLAILQLMLGVGLLILVFTSLAVLRHCVDTGDDDIDMRRSYRKLKSWLNNRKISRDDRIALHDSLFFEGRGTKIEVDRFVLFMALSATIATIAIIAESPAVVIGAMLIAPLMAPLMSTTIALFMGWPKRLTNALVITIVGVAVAILVSMLVSLMIPGDIDIDRNSEVLPRISPTLLDLWVAIAAGCAGALALSRQDRFTSISGAAVAIALVPPLATTGLTLQQAEWAAAYGSFLLFLTNAVAIVLISGLVFVLTGVVPVTMLGRSQSRLGVAVVTLQVAALVVFAGLMINGQTATISLLRRDRIRADITEWLEQYPEIELDSFLIEDNHIDLRLSGPGESPELEDLGERLKDNQTDSQALNIDMRWTPTVRKQYSSQ